MRKKNANRLEELNHAITLHPNSSNIKGMFVSPEVRQIMRNHRRLTVKKFPCLGVKPEMLEALRSIIGNWVQNKEYECFECYQYQTPTGNFQDIIIYVSDLDGLDFLLPNP